MVTGSIKDAKITFPYDLRSGEITNNKLNAGESAKIAKGPYVAEDIIVSVKKSSGTDAKNILKGNSITIDILNAEVLWTGTVNSQTCNCTGAGEHVFSCSKTIVYTGSDAATLNQMILLS